METVSTRPHPLDPDITRRSFLATTCLTLAVWTEVVLADESTTLSTTTPSGPLVILGRMRKTATKI